MKKIIYATLACIISIGAFAQPAMADRVTLSIGDAPRNTHWDRHERFERYHHRHPAWGYSDYYYREPVVIYETPYIVQNYPVAPPQVASTYQAPPGYCREYNGPVRVGGRIQQSYGTACLMPDGSWRIVN